MCFLRGSTFVTPSFNNYFFENMSMGTGIMCGAAQNNGGIVALKKLTKV